MTQKIREGSVGGTSAAAIAGLSPYCTPYGAWLRLMGTAPPKKDSPAMRWGRLLESVIADVYARDRGLSITVPEESIVHPQYGWRHATPDAIVVDSDGKHLWGLEVKTAGAHYADRWGEAGTSHVPPGYQAQCDWYMHVLDLDRWDVAVLIGGQDYRTYTINRDGKRESAFVDTVARFWREHVLTGTPPPMTVTEQRGELVGKWDRVQGEYIKADNEIERLVAEVQQWRRLARDYADMIAADENRLRERIADAPGVVGTFGKVMCRPWSRRVTDWEAVARRLAADAAVPGNILSGLITSETRDTRPSRPLRYPKTTVVTGWDDAAAAANLKEAP